MDARVSHGKGGLWFEQISAWPRAILYTEEAIRRNPNSQMHPKDLRYLQEVRTTRMDEEKN